MHKQIEEKISLVNYTYIDENINIDDLRVTTIKTSHDSGESRGYVFESNDKSIVYITDTGYINKRYHNVLKNKNLYVMESNHDVKMLMETNRPHHLKIRILSDEGHLSNEKAAYYLSEFIGPKTNYIVLAHLSEEANCPKIAKKVIKNTLCQQKNNVKTIYIAEQKERTELIEI